MRFWVALACLAAVVSQAYGQATGPRRRALLIVNSQYRALAEAPSVNVTELDSALRRSGFAVTARENLNFDSFVETLDTFAEQTRPGDVCLFYFAGHTLREGDSNYLVPTDFSPSANGRLASLTVALLRLPKLLASKSAGLQLVLVEQTREDEAMRKRYPQLGLSDPYEPPDNSVYAFAAAAEQEPAVDAPAAVFTKQLVSLIEQPNLEISRLIDQLASRVAAATHNAQKPYTGRNNLAGEFYFVRREEPPAAPAPVRTKPAVVAVTTPEPKPKPVTVAAVVPTLPTPPEPEAPKPEPTPVRTPPTPKPEPVKVEVPKEEAVVPKPEPTKVPEPPPTTLGRGAQLFSLAHPKPVKSVAFSPDGLTVATACFDGQVRIWNVKDGTLRRAIAAHDGPAQAVAFSPDGKYLASSAARDLTIRLWDPVTGQAAGALRGHTEAVVNLAFSADGRFLASASYDKTIILWDTTKMQPSLPPFKGHSNYVLSVAFSPDGNLLASGGYDKTIRIWSTSTGKKLEQLPTQADTVASVAFSPVGSLMAVTGLERSVLFWDVDKKTAVGRLDGHDAAVLAVAFSPQGNFVASGSFDNTMKLWDAQKRSLIETFRGHQKQIMSVAFSPNGRLLATASFDGTVKIWAIYGQP